MRPRRESLGELFVPVDFQVRVFGTSGIVYRPSEHLSVQNIPLYGCIDRLSCFMPFVVMNQLIHQEIRTANLYQLALNP